MEKVETIEYKGFSIDIYPDHPEPESPREWENLGTMVCFHGRYELGDPASEHGHTPDDILDVIKQADVLVLPIYMYDYSGIWLSTNRKYFFNCYWDSGQVGVIYTTKEKAKKWMNWKKFTKKRRDKILNILQGEVEVYSDYLSGAVYGYVIDDLAETVGGSVWGFYGSNLEKSGLLTAAREEIDYYIQDRKKEQWKRLKGYITNKIPLIYRKPFKLLEKIHKK